MIRVLFICHGNICRSPMAEFIFKDMLQKSGKLKDFQIASAATSLEEIGHDIYSPAKRVLYAHSIPFEHRQARRVTAEDMESNDFIIIMDENNLRYLHRLFGSGYDSKIRMLMSFAGQNRDVSDPWYTDDFETAYRDIVKGCQGLMQFLEGNS